MSSLNVAALILAAAFCLGCGDDADPAGPFVSANNVTITRANGSAVSFAPSIWVWCGAWEEGEVPEPAVHVLVGSATARWELHAVRRDITIGQQLTFPNSFIWNEPRRADIFVHDPPNELSTQSSASSGHVVFEQLDCGPGGGVKFQIDAVIDSELGDLPSVTARGSFSSPLTGPPTR